MNLLQIQRRRRAANKGFNLIEAAIVLGIVGLVVGGIWVAAASVYDNLRSKTATDQLLSIAQAMRSLYATSATVDPANGTNLTAIVAPANVLPSNTLTTTPDLTTSANTSNPWGGNLAVFSAPSSNALVGGGFVIQFTRVPAAACANFLMRNAGQGRDSGMYAVDGAAAGAAAYNAPPGNAANGLLTPGTALTLVLATNANLCASAGANAPINLSYYFNLRG